MNAAGFPIRHFDTVYEAKQNGSCVPGIAIALRGRNALSKHDGLFVDVKRLTSYHRGRIADWAIFNKLAQASVLYHVTRIADPDKVTIETSLDVFLTAKEAEIARKNHPRSRVVAKAAFRPTKKLAKAVGRKSVTLLETEALLLALFSAEVVHFDGLWHGRSGVLFKAARSNWKRTTR